jgi:hypothetical protein
MRRPPALAWWLDAYCGRARLIEGDVVLEPRHPALAFRGPAWRLVYTEVRRALAEGLTVLDACERWYSGAFLLETVPSVLYILARHGDDPEQALIRAVNDTKDNDTIGAIVGAALGALHGRSALPERWVTGLLGDVMGEIMSVIDNLRDLRMWLTTDEAKAALRTPARLGMGISLLGGGEPLPPPASTICFSGRDCWRRFAPSSWGCTSPCRRRRNHSRWRRFGGSRCPTGAPWECSSRPRDSTSPRQGAASCSSPRTRSRA